MKEFVNPLPFRPATIEDRSLTLISPALSGARQGPDEH